MRRPLMTALLALVLAAPAARAEDIALLLGTERYATLDRLARGTAILGSAPALAEAGFRVFALSDGTAAETAATLAGFLAVAPAADRIVVALSGRFVTDGRLTWLLTADAPAPAHLALGDRAVSVDALLSVLARAPGQALLLLATDRGEDARADTWLGYGLPVIDAPQGVAVLAGPPRDLADFIAAALATPGTDLAAAAAASGRIDPAGFWPRPFVFRPAATTPVAPGDTVPHIASASAEEEALWTGVLALDTVAAFRSYLDAYPAGRYAAEAQAAIVARLAEPDRDARLAEEALALTPAARRDIQNDLTLLGFTTRGIDGLFGPATRGAITAWQQQEGFAQTGYLTAEQIGRIDAAAARRTAQREAEAARAAQIAAAADRAFWDETGGRGDRAGLAAYLARYPEGIFAATATAELARLAAAESEADRAAWDTASATGTTAALRAYLRDFSDGAFRAEAEDRLRNLAADSAATDSLATTQTTEEALSLDTATLGAVEQSLADLGLDPGPADGRIELASRRAIRAFQRQNGLPPTGFLDTATLDRLLTGIVPAPLPGP